MTSGFANNIGSLLESSGGRSGEGKRRTLTLAEVKDINDDQKLNRVRCLPIGAPDNEITDWCYVMTPMGGAERGLFLFPQVGDLVVLGYLENDPHRPIVLGSFWCTESKPPLSVENGKAEDYCLKTPNKVEFSIHDEKNKQKLTLTTPSGITVEVDDEKQTVTTKDKNGKNSLTLLLKDGAIELKAAEKITLTAGQASVTLQKNGDIDLNGKGKVTLQGKSADIKAQGQLNLQGLDAAVKATKDLNLSATGNASLKGMLLKLN